MWKWPSRRPREAPAQTPAPQFQGAVLLDNTTVFGARRALEWEPALSRTLPPGVDLRSLMDVLEMIVLANDLLVDSASRVEHAWPDLERASDNSSSFYLDTELSAVGEVAIVDELFDLSIQQASHLVASGELRTQLGFLPSLREVEVLPDIYRDHEDFVDKTMSSVYHIASPSMVDARPADSATLAGLRQRLDDFVDGLDILTPELRNFALFTFRGFYYQQLAHLLSLSYVPHAWRSGAIASQLTEPVDRFRRMALGVGEQLRKEVRDSINAEFTAPALRAEFPLIASYVIGQATSRGDLLRTAIDIRDTAKAARFRGWILDIETRIRDEHDLGRIKQAQDELTDLVQDLRADFGLAERAGQEIKIRLGLPTPVTPSVESAFRVHRPYWMERVLRRRTHLVFLRELARESVSLPPFIKRYEALPS
ncbi:hypothetical protein ACGFJ7_20540 [Actinoplanes sp. NPDC048988]|uniref:hypothetical protein n=1 Tax=Actinoplanes sp. NPDC048988 TaxID=3363901 RepID=UPI0037121C83